MQVIELQTISACASCSYNWIGCFWKGGITVRSPHMRQPCLKESFYLPTKYDLSIESTGEWTSHPFFESNSAWTNTTFLDVFLAMCGRVCVSFYLLRSHMEDSFYHISGTAIRWELWQRIGTGDFSKQFEPDSVVYEERGRDQLWSLAVAETCIAKSVADIFTPGLVLISQWNFSSIWLSFLFHEFRDLVFFNPAFVSLSWI